MMMKLITPKTKLSALTLSTLLLFACNQTSSLEDANDDSIDETEPTTVTVDDSPSTTETPAGNAVLIQDTSNDEAGEIRFSLDAAQAAGTLSVNIRMDAAETELSSIALFGSSTSTDNAVIDLKMGSNNSDNEDQIGIKLRAKKIDGISQSDIETALEYPSNTWTNVSIQWDVLQAQVTITLKDLDGVELGSEVHDMQTSVDVEKIIFKIGDSSGLTTSEAPYYIDDIIVSDESGTVLVSDDFSESTLNARYTTKSSVTVTDAQNATVVDDTEANTDTDTGTETDTSTETTNFAASIIDTTLNADGELRLRVDAIAAGSVSATIQLQADADTQMPSNDNVDGINNTAYIDVYSASASSDNLVGEISFVSSGATNYRDANKSQQLIDGLTYSENTPLTATIRWDAANYWVSLDGGFTEYGPYTGIFAGNPVTHIQFRIGSSSRQATNEMIVDDIVIADSEDNIVLSEDFDTGYTEGEALSSTYSSSAEATAEEIDL